MILSLHIKKDYIAKYKLDEILNVGNDYVIVEILVKVISYCQMRRK